MITISLRFNFNNSFIDGSSGAFDSEKYFRKEIFELQLHFFFSQCIYSNLNWHVNHTFVIIHSCLRQVFIDLGLSFPAGRSTNQLTSLVLSGRAVVLHACLAMSSSLGYPSTANCSTWFSDFFNHKNISRLLIQF